MLSPGDAMAWCMRLVVVALVISAAEPLVAWRYFDDHGPLGARLSGLQKLTARRRARPVHDLVDHDRVFVGLCVAQLALSAAVFVSPDSRLGWPLLVVASLVFVRLQVGLDGSDAMARIILTANAIRLIDVGRLTDACVLFLAAEVSLAMFTSGFSKLGSTVWLEGRSLAKTLTTVGYGDPVVSRLLWRHPELGRVASWATIAVEVSFPLALVLPLPLAVALLATALVFHVSCARIMALGPFVWAFGATYPCVIAARDLFHLSAPVEIGLLGIYVAVVTGQLWATVTERRRPPEGAPSRV
jgi:hypothetical protein